MKKIAYLCSPSISDSEFPLIKELQRRKLNMIFYFPIEGKSFNKGLISIDKVKKCNNIIKASEYEAFRRYEGYLKLDDIYVINNYHCNRRNWQSWVIWIKFMKHLINNDVKLLHYCWPFTWQRRILYLLNIPMVMTVHDPLPHSSHDNKSGEYIRKRAFKHSLRFLLLSDIQKEAFSQRYNVPYKKISIAKFGLFDWISKIDFPKVEIKKNYIFFWGQIQAHKGIDTLLQAMIIVHQQLPDLNLIIAGKGKFYFDITPYKELDYIEIRNYYLTTEEMIGLLKGCLFAVAPYKDATQSGVVQTAFSAGVPIIVTNVGTMPLMVSNEMTGYVIPPDDVNSLADSIINLASNKKLIQEFSRNIETFWKKEMSWEPIGEKYVEFYSTTFSEI